MCTQVVFTCEKKIGDKLDTLLRSRVFATSCMLVDQRFVPKSGLCVEYQLIRERDRVDVLAVLGDLNSEKGPWNGKCWIVVADKRGYWSRWRRPSELYDEVQSLLLAEGASL